MKKSDPSNPKDKMRRKAKSDFTGEVMISISDYSSVRDLKAEIRRRIDDGKNAHLHFCGIEGHGSNISLRFKSCC